jgi:malic enzyme
MQFLDLLDGTAVVCLAAIINGLKLMKMKPSEVKLVINGAG